MKRILKIIDVENGKVTNKKTETLKKNDGNQTKFEYIDNFLQHWPQDKIENDPNHVIIYGHFQIIGMYSDGTFSASEKSNIIRDGFNIEGIDVGNIICIKGFEHENTFEIHFNGTIENDQSYEFSFEVIKNSKRREEEVLRIATKILTQYNFECYQYTKFDDIHDNIKSANNIKGYDENQAYMIEVFSNLVDPIDYEQLEFGLSDEYIDAIIGVRYDMRKLKKEIECKFKKENVKVTLSKWNQGCENGMAMYIWIPFQ